MTEPAIPHTPDPDVLSYAAVPEINPIPDAPYRGVEPFRFIDQQIFVAREDETWSLISSIMIYRGVLLYGSSGSGKSSMINAGLIPQALKENFVPNILRVQPWRNREIKIERIAIEQDGKPPYLPSTFTTDDSQASFECSIEDIHRTLKNIIRTGPTPGPMEYTKSLAARPLLIFDQFEEFVTLFEEAGSIATGNGKGLQKESVQVQQAILDAVTDLIHDERLPIKILFVFREDYLGKLSILFENSPDLLDQYLRLVPPKAEKLKQIICAPFRNDTLNAAFAKGKSQVKVEQLSKLADLIAAELRQHSGGVVNLSELQIVCRKLWESDNPAELMKKEPIVQTLIEDYWADALNKLPEELYEPAVALLGHLITSSNTRNIVSEDDLLTDEKERFDQERLRKALDALVQTKLVRREPRFKLYFYEIVSEYLVPWIQRLKAAQRAELDRIKARTQLKHAEARNRTLRTWTRGLVTLAALLVIASAGLAYVYRRAKFAERAARDAETSKQKEAEAKQKALDTIGKYSNFFALLQKLTSTSADARLTAINDIEALPEPPTPEQRRVLAAMILADSDKNVVDAGKKLLNAYAKEQPESEQRVEIHLENVDNQDQKLRADRMRYTLAVKGMLVDDRYQYGSAPATNQVRYCNIASEGIQPDAIAEILNDIEPGNKWTAVAIPGCGNASTAQRNYYQVFFASDKGPVQRELMALETQWKNAKVSGNVAVLQRIFADDFTNISQFGNPYTKKEWIDELRGPNPGFGGWQMHCPKLLDYGGNTAMLRFILTAPAGNEVDIDVFVKRSGRWQVLSSQSTPLALSGEITCQ